MQVLPTGPFDKTFDYRVPDGLWLEEGQIVEVPFGRRHLFGVVWATEAAAQVPSAKLKDIERVLDLPPLPLNLRQFVQRVASYTFNPLGNILKLVFGSKQVLESGRQQLVYYAVESAPADLQLTAQRRRVMDVVVAAPGLPLGDICQRAQVSGSVVKGLLEQGGLVASLTEAGGNFEPVPVEQRPVKLSDAQAAAAGELAAAAQAHAFGVYLLDGVTGSGKTETYMEGIAAALARGEQVLVLLPEIALTPQLQARFEHRFGYQPHLWHSNVSVTEKRQLWRAILHGKARMVVGARSALFLPFSNLGYVVVDEEHDTSYKQEEGVIYHGRDMAVLRAQTENCPIVLSSATPSLESYYNAQQQRYHALELSQRHGEAQLPDVTLIDMRAAKLKGPHWISTELQQAMAETLARGEQSLLFLNRRGYAPLTLCRTCGHRFQCPSCSAWLVSHGRGQQHLLCHHCGHFEKLPKACPQCSEEDSLTACGPGVERIAEEVKTLFPDARREILASDLLASNEDLQNSLRRIHDHEVDIIVGTQLVAKGHHFPHLTLVGVVDADVGLSGGDPRAAEKTFQMLHQVAGRAGRAEKPGRGFIQTWQPEGSLMKFLASQDRDGFFNEELRMRQLRSLPPFGRLAAVILSDRDANRLQSVTRHLAIAQPQVDGVEILGPAPPPLEKLRGRHRLRFLVRGQPQISLQKVIAHWLTAVKLPPQTKLQVDIDPVSFL